VIGHHAVEWDMTHDESERHPLTGPASPPHEEAETADLATPSPARSASNFPVVAVGASAGGLEALTGLLEAMPDDCGLAIVVINHANPHHESLMVDLLSRHTAMPMAFAHNGALVEPNHVYVIPPNSFLALRDGALHLSPPETGHNVRLPIDFFLRSLASACRERAVAIILSGTGSDGTLGVTAVKENGGMAMAQDPAEAGQDGMPRSAIATRFIDHILRVAEMPARLIDYARHSYTRTGMPPPVLGERARAGLMEVIAVLKTQSPVNFELYKEGTLLRRIERRMGLRHVEDPGQYLAFLKEHPEEIAQLHKDLLISVTSFFRDPAAFEDLAETILPDLVRGHPADRPIRAWVAGCATGEEAYSIAMLLIEKVSALRKDLKLQVFASDIDEEALETARDGRYPDAIEADVSPERLQRFFIREDYTYRVVPELRETVIFAKQNLLSDPPFSRLDLVTCRNVLIYLNPAPQERIISIFHFALVEGGALVLGLSETVGTRTDMFQPLSRKSRIFRSIGGRHRLRIDYPVSSVPAAPIAGVAAGAAGPNRPAGWTDLSHKALLEHYAPAAVLVSENFEVLYFHGATDRYLRMPPGEPRHALLALAREGLGSELGAALREARQRRETTARNATARRDGQNFLVTITVHPVTSDHAPLLLVTFADHPAPAAEPPASVSAVDHTVLHLLEQELKSTKQDLQNTIADLERSNEELKAANEEATSLNEEFQSTNEELETSKEELQSLNEELTSLNAQLQHKIEGERVISDDLGNLLVSSDIATLFLDRNFNIKRFTRPATRLFNLIASDVGRPFSDISRGVDDPELMKDIESVLAELTTQQREVKGKQADWYIRRVLPYRTQENRIDGVVITFTEVSKLKAAETQAKAAQAFAENIVNTLHEALIVLDPALRVVAASASFYKTFRIKPEDAVGRLIFDLDDRQWDIPKLRELLLRVIPDTTTVEDFEVEHDFPRLGHRIALLNARRIGNADDTDGLCLVTIEDITQRRAAEQALMEREAYLKAVLATAPDGIITIDERGIVKSFSPAAERLFDFTEAEIVGNNVSQYLKAGEAKIGRGREVIGLRKDGTELPLRLSVAEMKLPGHRVFVGILHDLTEEKRRNEEHLQAQKMEALGQLAGGIAHDFNNLLTIIIGNNERIQAGVEESELRALLDQNYNAAERGGRLTKRLLSFAHRSRLEPTTLHLNERVSSMMDMLHRTIGEGIVVTSVMAPDLWHIRVDPGEVDHALLNLMLNARDAMPSGGTVAIETANETFAAGGTPADLVAGDYVRLSVVDTGVGMTPNILKRAVDPFFTTKPPGKGTGLGLASAYGFAKQSGGCLVIASKLGKGTTVSLYLPRASGEVPPLASANEPGIPLGNGELVLVVDDDDEVREVTLRRLEALGYAVIEAASGPKAIERCAGERVALALIDIVMPGGLSGYEVAENLRKLNPGIKVLLTTGYDGAGRKSKPEAIENFKVLEKPYTRAELAQAIAEALAG
jgi:two-component system CheB/CheR fusion protein